MKLQYYPRFDPSGGVFLRRSSPPPGFFAVAAPFHRAPPSSASPASFPAAVRSSLAGRPPFPAMVRSSLIGCPSAPRSAAPSPTALPAGCLLHDNFGSFVVGHRSFAGRLPPLQSRAQGQPLRCPLLLILSSLLLSTPIKRICPSLSTPL